MSITPESYIWMKHRLEWDYDTTMDTIYNRFFKRIDDTSNWNAGRRLMYSLAKKLNITAKKIGEPPFSKDFFAYALDGEMDRDLDKTFIKCGASKQQVAAWKKAGKL